MTKITHTSVLAARTFYALRRAGYGRIVAHMLAAAWPLDAIVRARIAGVAS